MIARWQDWRTIRRTRKIRDRARYRVYPSCPGSTLERW